MVETETDFDLVEVCANCISIGWHGNAVLVRKGLIVRDIEKLGLPGFEQRGALR
jgi:endonuclease/exonuclease/phosphatase family metal-dependent hydrolase